MIKELQSIIGAPYAFPSHPPESFDCWTLLVYVRNLHGLRTEVEISPSRYTPETLRNAVTLEKCMGGWRRVSEDSMMDGDAVLFTPSHIGVSLGVGVLHAFAPSKGVLFTRWPVVKRRWPQLEVWHP